MAKTRMVAQFGMGTSIRSRNYTEAAARDLGYDPMDMRAEVTIGAQEPDKVDAAVVTVELPRGRAVVTVVHGGLNVHDPENGATHVVATAAIAAFPPLEASDWHPSAAPAGGEKT